MILNFEILTRATSINLDIVLSKVFRKKEVKRFIEDLNREQLRNHVDSKDKLLQYKDAKGRIRLGYSPLTKNKEKAGTPFTLFDKGKFYKSIKATNNNNSIYLTSNPIEYDVYIYKRFGKQIIGLNKNSIQKLQKFIKPIFILEVKRKLLLINR